jgi:hypothetical protein
LFLSRDRAFLSRDRAFLSRDRAFLSRDRAFLSRDRAFLSRDRKGADVLAQPHLFELKQATLRRTADRSARMTLQDLRALFHHLRMLRRASAWR